MKHVETSILIDATAHRVWQLLTDFPEHSRWNPFIRSIVGKLAVGERLRVEIAPPGQKGMRFRPRLLVVEPGRELRWRGRLIVPGLFDGEHYFRIEQQGSEVRLVHGECFSGLLVGLMKSSSFDRIGDGFEAMNIALKAEVERRS